MRTSNPGLVENAAALAKSDTVEVAVTSGIRVETSGSVKMVFLGGGTVTFSLTAGIDYPYRIKQIYSTGTDAITVYGLY